uniref:Uncharacterized protein n=1 Tax=Anguilla anguilla TaxID=7936 RepID=A0A0E9RB62_ANGAN
MTIQNDVITYQLAKWQHYDRKFIYLFNNENIVHFKIISRNLKPYEKKDL